MQIVLMILSTYCYIATPQCCPKSITLVLAMQAPFNMRFLREAGRPLADGISRQKYCDFLDYAKRKQWDNRVKWIRGVVRQWNWITGRQLKGEVGHSRASEFQRFCAGSQIYKHCSGGGTKWRRRENTVFQRALVAFVNLYSYINLLAWKSGRIG